MGLLTTILDFFRRSVQRRKPDGELSKEMNEEILKSVEAFKNRPIHKRLTEQIIDSTPDENLLQVVFDNLCEKIPDYEKEFETVRSWDKYRQAIYMIWLLEGEVNNGGFNQFYFNSSGQFYEHLPAALHHIGASRFADLTQRANETYEGENEKITRHQDGTLVGFSKSYVDNPLNGYDDEFYALYKVEDLQKLQIAFIRKNKQEFIDR